MQNAEGMLQNLEYRMQKQNEECRMQNREYRMHNAEFSIQDAECRMQNTEAGIVLLYLERKSNIYSQEFSVSGKKQVSLIWEECNEETSSQSVTEIQSTRKK